MSTSSMGMKSAFIQTLKLMLLYRGDSESNSKALRISSGLTALPKISDPVLSINFLCQLELLSSPFPAHTLLSFIFLFLCVFHNTLGTVYRATSSASTPSGRRKGLKQYEGQQIMITLTHKQFLSIVFQSVSNDAAVSKTARTTLYKVYKGIIKVLQGTRELIYLNEYFSPKSKGFWSSLTYSAGHTTAQI